MDKNESASPSKPPSPVAAPPEQADASRKEVVIYALGNAEASISDQFPNLLQSIMVVAMQVSPLLLGLIMGIKTIWDSVTDPIMAHITDNTRTRWGRRRPYILMGGLSRVTFLVLFVAFLPGGVHLASNELMEAQKFVNESSTASVIAHETAVKAYEQFSVADTATQKKMLDLIESIPASAKGARATIERNLPTLHQDASARDEVLRTREAELLAVAGSLADAGDSGDALAVARGLVDSAREKSSKAHELIDRAGSARRSAIAAEVVARHVLAAGGRVPDADVAVAAAAQATADAAFAEAGLENLNIFALVPKPAPKSSPAKSSLAKVTEGLKAFWDPRNADQRSLVLYVLIGMLIYTVFTTVFSVPYYALGIELSPSYDGRTQVVTYRAILNKFAGLLGPWVPVACFSLFFRDALQGLFWISVAICVVGIPCTILMFVFTRERTHINTGKTKGKVNLFRSMWQISKNPDFLRIFALYTFIGLVNGLFAQVGFFLNVYWVMGSALSGATLGAWVSMVAWVLGFICLPIINWGCRRFEKHRVLGFAIIWMAIGTALKWWAMDPAHPEYQFILPFFFSIGISSVFTVLPTMMADVTDVDELRHGLRREGMFGAVMAFLMKLTSALVPIMAGAVLVMAGFDPSLEYHQEASTITNMRLMYSFLPAGMLLLALLLLIKYPLSRKRVLAIKEELKLRNAREDQAAGV